MIHLGTRLNVLILNAVLFAKIKYRPIAIPEHCAMTVARAAPLIPISGKGPIPMIRNGSRSMFITLAVIMITVGFTVSPDPRIRPPTRNIKTLAGAPNAVITRYILPISMILSVAPRRRSIVSA